MATIKEVEENYEKINTPQRYGIMDFAKLQQKLLPEGDYFDIPLPDEKQIWGESIKSEETFGLTTVLTFPEP